MDKSTVLAWRLDPTLLLALLKERELAGRLGVSSAGVVGSATYTVLGAGLVKVRRRSDRSTWRCCRLPGNPSKALPDTLCPWNLAAGVEVVAPDIERSVKNGGPLGIEPWLWNKASRYQRSMVSNLPTISCKRRAFESSCSCRSARSAGCRWARANHRSGCRTRLASPS